MPITVKVPGREFYNDETDEFAYTECSTITMEHSLLSISKWESKWHKPFFSQQKKTNEELIDYLRCMSLSQNIDSNAFYAIDAESMDRIQKYIEDPMTATTFSDNALKPSREIITSELFYYWMTALNIPFDPCQKWHINRLKALIQVCAIKNQPPKKMSKSEIMKQNAALNAARRKRMGSKG